MTIDFKYDTASEIFRDNVNPTQVPMIEHELIDNVTFFFDRIPEDYQLDLNYQINDLQEYTYDEISEAYVNELELDHCLAYKRSKSITFNAALLIIIGCCICHKKFTGYGNDPQPVKQTGRCCDHCNQTVVIPARIKELNDTIAEW